MIEWYKPFHSEEFSDGYCISFHIKLHELLETGSLRLPCPILFKFPSSLYCLSGNRRINLGFMQEGSFLGWIVK